MSSTEGLAYAALFVLAISLLLTNHLILATVAIVPYVLASFKYSFPKQKKPSGRIRSTSVKTYKKRFYEVILT